MKETFYSVIRIFVECTEAKAKILAYNFTKLFDKPALALDIEKYYKESNWYEISFHLEQINTTPNKALKEVGEILGTGWMYNFMETDDDFSSYAIWNPANDAIFISPYVRFANLETFISSQTEISENDYLTLD